MKKGRDRGSKSKSKARKSGSIATKTQVPATLQSHPTLEQTPIYRRLIPAAKRTVAAMGGAISVASGLYWLWTQWPRPAFSPGFPSAGSAFDIPFNVSNRSDFFPLINLKITCVLRNVRAQADGNVLLLHNAPILAHGKNRMEAGQSASFTCPFRGALRFPKTDAADAITQAEIEFESVYELPLFGVPISSKSDTFTLVLHASPPRWIPGVPLKR